jgi:hypothetical protein
MIRERGVRGRALLAAVAAASLARPAAARPAVADIALVGADPPVASVRAVAGELLEREGVAVSWSRLDRLGADTILDVPMAGGEPEIAVWIDVSSSAEARLYFRDAAGQRFVIRRLALENGYDGVAVEEIAQVTKSVLLALAAGTEPALSRAEARAVLRPPAVIPSPSPPPSPPPPRRRLAVEIGLASVTQLFSPQVALSNGIQVSVAAIGHLPRGALGGWLALGYTFPVGYRSPSVGLDVESVTARVGALWEPWRSDLISIRVGVGGGIDWVSFQPRTGSADITPAGAGHFLAPLATGGASVVLVPSGRLSFSFGAGVDLGATDIHYDVVRDGTPVRVLVPYRLRPGLSLGAAWRF